MLHLGGEIMARVNFVKKARKAIPEAGIAVGDSYYYVKLRRGMPKRYFKERPPRSATTGSSFYSTLWDIEDVAIGKLEASDDLKGNVEDISQQLRDLAQECQDSLDNMPEGLQQGSSGTMLQERVEALEAAADEFDNLDFDDKQEDETDEEFWERKLEEVQAVSIDAP
jgi:hypothetical protein